MSSARNITFFYVKRIQNFLWLYCIELVYGTRLMKWSSATLTFQTSKETNWMVGTIKRLKLLFAILVKLFWVQTSQKKSICNCSTILHWLVNVFSYNCVKYSVETLITQWSLCPIQSWSNLTPWFLKLVLAYTLTLFQWVNKHNFISVFYLVIAIIIAKIYRENYLRNK